MAQKIRKDDKVKIVTGKDKGKEGKVLKVFKDTGKVLVEGVNVVKRHVKPGVVSQEGGIISVEKPIDMSNAMVVCSKCSRPVRVGFKTEKDKKVRICRRCGESLK